MKKIITVVFLAALSFNTFAAIRCVPSGGGTCCWDTNIDGPFKPIGC
jgi:hypothetical protein